MTETNRIIAEFMGAEDLSPKTKFSYLDYGDNWGEHFGVFQQKIHTNFLCYHSDWGWLMPVVTKIEAMGFEVNICGTYCKIGDGDLSPVPASYTDDKLQSTYTAVVAFINWYNTQNKSNEKH